MSKQVNLTLAAAGDVAVLRNGVELPIESVLPIAKSNSITKSGVYGFILEMNLDNYMYTLKGEYWHGETDGRDIIDVTRNGESIFND